MTRTPAVCLVLGAVLIPARTALADDAPIHLTVTGNVDARAVRDSIASELGRAIETADDRCAAPCLTVVVGGGRATIVFAQAATSRQRTVDLGRDHHQWPLVITLLAGNLVRDEAADVLAMLPDPPSVATEPAAPTEPAASAEAQAEIAPVIAVPAPMPVSDVRTAHDEPELHPFEIGLVPVLSTDLLSFDHTRHLVSIDLIAGVSDGASGVAIAGIVDIAERSWGVQLAGVAAITGHLQGVQLAGIGAIADTVDGIQAAGIGAIADRVEGMQAAGIATLADHADTQLAGVVAASDHVNVQLAGVAAVTDTAHLQIAGAVAAADSANIQIAGAVNFADDVNVQIAGAVNVADRVTGLQIAPINFADRVDGIQLGILNIGGSADGNSFGLINIIPGGRYDLEATVDANRTGTLLFRHGGRKWHNVYGIGGHRVDSAVSGQTGSSNDVWMYGAGFGPTWRIGGTVVDVEALAWEVNHGTSNERDLSLLAQLRLSIAFGMYGVPLVVGATLNTYISTDHNSPLLLERTTGTPMMPMDSSVATTVWPSVFVGARI